MKNAINSLLDTTGGAVASSVGSQIQYGLGNITGYNRKLRDDQLDQQDALNKIQQKYNFMAMDKQQEMQKNMIDYTDASHQVQRIKDAGLSVGLMYGGGGAGGTTTGNGSALGVSGAGASDETSRASANIAQQGMAMQLAKLKSEIDVNESIAKKNNTEAGYTEGAKTEETVNNIELLKANTTNIVLKNQYQEYDNVVKKIESEIAMATQENVIDTYEANLKILNEQYRNIGNNNEITEASKKSLIGINQANLSNILADTALKKSNISINDAKISEIKVEIQKMISEIGRMAVENKVDLNNSESMRMNAISGKINAMTESYRVKIQAILSSAGLDMEKAKMVTSTINQLLSTGATVAGAGLLQGGLKTTMSQTVTRPVYDTESGQVINRTFTQTTR